MTNFVILLLTTACADIPDGRSLSNLPDCGELESFRRNQVSADKRLSDDLARQKELIGLVSAQQRVVSKLTDQIESTEHSSTFTDNEQKEVVVSWYNDDLQKAITDERNAIDHISSDPTVLWDEKDQKIKDLRQKTGPQIYRLRTRYDDARQRTEMTDSERSRILGLYRQTLAVEQPKLDALLAESDTLPAQIEDDRKQVRDAYAAEEVRHARIADTTRGGFMEVADEFETRKKRRWRIMENGTYGGRWDYDDSTKDKDGNYIEIPVFRGRFSTDGTWSIFGDKERYDCGKPWLDTPEMRLQIRALRDESKEDLDAYMASKLRGNYFFHRNLNRQIRFLEERMRHEDETL